MREPLPRELVSQLVILHLLAHAVHEKPASIRHIATVVNPHSQSRQRRFARLEKPRPDRDKR